MKIEVNIQILINYFLFDCLKPKVHFFKNVFISSVEKITFMLYLIHNLIPNEISAKDSFERDNFKNYTLL